MQKRWLSSIRLPAEIGRLIAGEFQLAFDQEVRLRALRATEIQRIAQVTRALRHAVYEATESFNHHSPWNFHLAVLDKGDRLIFASQGEFTLTMQYGDGRLSIEPSLEKCCHTEILLMDVWLEQSNLQFRDRTSPDPALWCSLDQTAFLALLIRRACSPQWFEGTALRNGAGSPVPQQRAL